MLTAVQEPRLTRFDGFDVPVLAKPHVLGRYANREESIHVYRPADIEAERAQIAAARELQARHFARHGTPGPVQMLRRGMVVEGGDFVAYETCPSVQVAAGAVTAASTSIQVLPSAVSPLFAGAGGGTAGVAGFWYQGRSLRLTLWGIGTTSTSPGSTTFQWNVATSQNVTTGNSMGSSAIALAASLSNISWTFEGNITCQSVGTAGKLFAMGTITLGTLASTNVVNVIPASAPATATIDTTSNSAINFLVTLGATTVTLTVELGYWEVLN